MKDDQADAVSPICVDRRGNVFIELRRGDEQALLHSCHDAPLTHALIVVEFQGRFLFVHNTRRREWELAGGIIDSEESPRQCAVRELAEESGQTVDNAEFRGLMKFKLRPDDRLEYGALYYARLEHRQRFTPNAEADRMVFWDLMTDIGNVAEIDRRLVDLARRR
ncbi:MAG: NUDIX hydrolase [Planctomycetes bacterium]|nr:NUDIX hydrolase [Planctomycetota bacterium]